MVTSTFRRPWFSFQHPNSNSQPSLAPGPGDFDAFWLVWALHAHGTQADMHGNTDTRKSDTFFLKGTLLEEKSLSRLKECVVESVIFADALLPFSCKEVRETTG